MELCYEPFEHRGGLRASLDEPPATLLVLPNGWVKVAAALPQVCADLRHDRRSAQAWEAYRDAWRERYSDRGSAHVRSTTSRAMRAANTLAAAAGRQSETMKEASMSEPKLTIEHREGHAGTQDPSRPTPPDKPAWETPKLEDVSEQVMAQPYIRFT